MGIPKLMKDLAPYTERAIFGHKVALDVPVKLTALVIDGPSLVYEVYRRQMRYLSDMVSPLAYCDINAAVVDLLDEIQNHGVQIKKIYFDGALPESKRTTRLERLENHRQQLHTFIEHCFRKPPIKFCPQPPGRGKVIFQALEPYSLHTPKALEPAFMVASAIEHLRQSTYVSLVDLIPDEAEAGCVMYASQNPGVAMLSSDIDLVVFPDASYHSATLVLVRTLEEAKLDNESILMADCLRPLEISRRLNISSLPLLAFHRRMDPSASPSVIRQRAAATTLNPQEMSPSFLAEYDCIVKVEETLSRCAYDRSVHLDPRLSELRFQYRDSRHAINSGTMMHMYLPALFEDPSRESPWEHGDNLRQMAYSLLNLSMPSRLQRNSLEEFQRRGWKMRGRPIDLLNKMDLLKVFDEDTSLLQYVRIGESADATMKMWQKLALQAVNKRRAEDGRYTFLPAIHLSACIQAILYSLRILKQVAELLTLTAPTCQLVPQALLDKLATMPSLGDVMDTTQGIYPAR